jgi:hypothetical protein
MSWLISKALMNSLSLPELAEEYSQDASSAGEQSVQSSGNPIPQAYCAPDKMTEFSRLSRFGMTYKPLTEDHGEALCKSYREVFLVRTSQPLGGGQESTESEAECGEKWHGSFVKYDLDSSLWRTHQCSLLGDLEPFSETWPRWGLMRSGECWEQQTLAHRTSETESGLWRTPDTGAGGTSGLLKEGKTHRENGQPIQIRLVDQVNNPRLWPTPTAQDAKNNGAASQMVRNTKPLNAEVGGALNPMWVEWLMGWPLGWTDLKPLETDRFQKWLEEHGKCYDIGHEA